MPHYYFNVQNGQGFTPDDEGLDLEDEGAARAMAMESIRSIVAEEAREGVLDLQGYIDVLDHDSVSLTRIDFADAFSLRFPPDKTAG